MTIDFVLTDPDGTELSSRTVDWYHVPRVGDLINLPDLVVPWTVTDIIWYEPGTHCTVYLRGLGGSATLPA